MRYIIKNKRIDLFSYEKDLHFSFANGTEIVSNCYVVLHFYKKLEVCEFLDEKIVLLGNSKIPPINFCSEKCICEFHDDLSNFKVNISIKEGVKSAILLDSSNIVQKPITGFPVSIKIPRSISLMPCEAEIKTPDNSIIKIRNNSINFKWINKMLCINLPSGIYYNIRMRPSIKEVEFPWTNWLIFSVKGKTK